MSAKVQLCGECRWDGGQHFTVDDDGNVTVTRPHHEAARLEDAVEAERQRALALTALGREEALKHAKDIVAQIAETRPELSANHCHEAFEAAQIPEALHGVAFAQLADAETVIRRTGRHEMSRKKGTRHKIGVYESLVYRGARRRGVA